MDYENEDKEGKDIGEKIGGAEHEVVGGKLQFGGRFRCRRSSRLLSRGRCN